MKWIGLKYIFCKRRSLSRMVISIQAYCVGGKQEVQRGDAIRCCSLLELDFYYLCFLILIFGNQQPLAS